MKKDFNSGTVKMSSEKISVCVVLVMTKYYAQYLQSIQKLKKTLNNLIRKKCPSLSPY